MPFLKLNLAVEMFDQLVPDLPYVRRNEYDEVRAVGFQQATGGGYQAAPIVSMSTIQALILIPDQAVTVRVNGQTDAGTPVAAGGVFMVIGTTIDNSADDGVEIDNSSGSTVNVRGVAFGT